MKLPNHFKAIRSRWVAAFPLWSMPASADADERARRWSIGLMEQVAFEHPNEGWCVKRGDKRRPIGKDTAANHKLVLGRLLIWDLMTGAGTGTPRLNEDPESEDISGQGQFIEMRPEFFQPRNHLGVAPPPPPPPPPPPDADPLQLLQRVVALESAIAALKNRPPPPWPTYRGSKYGITIISHAEE